MILLTSRNWIIPDEAIWIVEQQNAWKATQHFFFFLNYRIHIEQLIPCWFLMDNVDVHKNISFAYLVTKLLNLPADSFSKKKKYS